MNRRILVLFVALGLFVFVGGILLYYLLNLSGGVHIPGRGQATPGSTSLPARLGSGCGVKKNGDGTYSFSWLHVSSDGKVVDENGCYVPLVGFNMGALFLGDAGVGNDGVPAVLNNITRIKQTFPMNVARVNFNSQWWVNDVLVPKANMHFRQWLQQYVKWLEQNGNYVELDLGPHFPEPPCGGTITLCPSQNQGPKDYQANPNLDTARELESNIAPGVQAWTDLAKLYANDPAVIYDAWNEPSLNQYMTLSAVIQDMNTLINTIRAQNPRALVVVFAVGMKDIMAGKYADYNQPNLVFDAHIYDGFHGTSPATGQLCSEPGKQGWSPSNSNFAAAVAFARSHSQAFIVNEWGGCYDSPDYNQAMISYAKDQGIALVYFHAGNVFNKIGGVYQLNDNGRLVQAGYASIMQGPS